MRQSPVNLDPDKLLYDPNLTELLVSQHRVSVYDRVFRADRFQETQIYALEENEKDE